MALRKALLVAEGQSMAPETNRASLRSSDNATGGFICAMKYNLCDAEVLHVGHKTPKNKAHDCAQNVYRKDEAFESWLRQEWKIMFDAAAAANLLQSSMHPA